MKKVRDTCATCLYFKKTATIKSTGMVKGDCMFEPVLVHKDGDDFCHRWTDEKEKTIAEQDMEFLCSLCSGRK